MSFSTSMSTEWSLTTLMITIYVSSSFKLHMYEPLVNQLLFLTIYRGVAENYAAPKPMGSPFNLANPQDVNLGLPIETKERGGRYPIYHDCYYCYSIDWAFFDLMDAVLNDVLNVS